MTAPDALLREALDVARKETRARHDSDSDWSHGAMWAINRLERALVATPPASAERDAVVEAAKAWRTSDVWYDLNHLNALSAAVDALGEAER
jgi:hypothetical protein